MTSIVKHALAAALGAAGMYWFDPEQGRRRRAMTRDRLATRLSDLRDATGVLRRDAGHRLHDVAANAHSLIRSKDVSDEVLVERVRAALRRATSHPGAIEVSCSQGAVTLRGAVLKHDHARVMRAARSAAGTNEVHDELSAYKQANGVLELQGEASLPEGPLTEHWSSTARLVMCASGASLAIWGLRRNPLIGLLATSAGGALFARGASNMTLKHLVEEIERRTLEPPTQPTAETVVSSRAPADRVSRPGVQ